MAMFSFETIQVAGHIQKATFPEEQRMSEQHQTAMEGQ